MRKLFVGLLATLMLVFAAAPAALALDHREGTRLVVEQNEVVNDDLALFGNMVEILGTVNGDVFAFGQTVIVKGTINGNLISGASNLDIAGTVTGSAYVGAENVYVSGRVDRTLASAGSRTIVSNSGSVGHTWLAVADRAELAGTVGRGMAAGASNLVINGQIGKELQAGVGNLTILSNAVINGPVNYSSDRAAAIDSGAQTGAVSHTLVKVDWDRGNQWWAGWWWQAFSFLSFLLAGMLVLALFPSLRRSFPTLVTEKPWQLPLAGFIALLVVPVALFVLLLTVVGIPLSLMGMLLFPVLIYFGQILVSWTAGQLLAERVAFMNGWAWPLVFLTGALLTTLMITVPGIGWVVSAGLLFYGLGGLYYLTVQRSKVPA